MNLRCETPLPERSVSLTGNNMNRVCHNVTLMYASSGREQEKHHCFFNNSLSSTHCLPSFKTLSCQKLLKDCHISANSKSDIFWSNISKE